MKPVVRKFEEAEVKRLEALRMVTKGDDDEVAKGAKKKKKGKGKRKKKEQKPFDIQLFNIGDTVEVWYKIIEGDKEREQKFEGTVIRKKGTGLKENFTVRRIVAGEGVERIFPMHSPKLMKVLVTRRGKVRRAKLYYLRDRVGKATKTPELLGEKANRLKERAKVHAKEVEQRQSAIRAEQEKAKKKEDGE